MPPEQVARSSSAGCANGEYKAPVTHHDHYQTLGVAPTATAEEIRQAYRRLAMRWHPDRNPDDPQAAEERFKGLQHAFAVLKDAGRRMAYDAERAAPRGAAGHGAGNGTGNGNGRGAHGPRPAREAWPHGGPRRHAQGKAGVDYLCETSIALETAVLGGMASTRVRMTVDCLHCDARGIRMMACKPCAGTGQVRRGLFHAYGACERCAGRGVEPAPCDACGGTGKVRVDKALRVQIKPGVIDGTVLRARGMGGAGIDGGPNGNLMCKVRVRKDRVFGVDGLDLTRELKIDFVLACLGGRVPVVRFRKTVMAEIPAMTRSGTVIRVRGMGLHDRAKQKTGDLLLTVAIDLPSRLRTLTESQQTLLRELGRGAGE